MKSIMVVAGTRPEIIKMAPLIRALEEGRKAFIFVHCGQHYDYDMSQKFIEELELPTPDYTFKIRAYSQGLQTAQIMVSMEKLLDKNRPTVVLVEGDTNGVLATALAAIKRQIPVGHVEAGLRSFDLRMPEEHNRRLVDHISTYLFAPTKNAQKNQMSESVWGEVHVTGNTVIDAVIQHLPIARKNSKILDEIKFERFILATAHRAENVDNPVVLKSLIESFAEAPLPVIYPIHPRTKQRLQKNKLWRKIRNSKNVQLTPPLGYLDFLVLMEKCELIITDSGGIQEEATAPPIRKRVLIMRLSTERPEAVDAGFAKVVGVKKESILRAIRETLNDGSDLPKKSPYGNGDAGVKIDKILASKTH
jgi:UDP-N-acetylglucosamine 2-epimerase (non-hydrolysing)